MWNCPRSVIDRNHVAWHDAVYWLTIRRTISFKGYPYKMKRNVWHLTVASWDQVYRCELKGIDQTTLKLTSLGLVMCVYLGWWAWTVLNEILFCFYINNVLKKMLYWFTCVCVYVWVLIFMYINQYYPIIHSFITTGSLTKNADRTNVISLAIYVQKQPIIDITC